MTDLVPKQTRLSNLTVRLAWTGPPAQARFARTGWDTSPASLSLLASLASLALTVLLHATQV